MKSKHKRLTKGAKSGLILGLVFLVLILSLTASILMALFAKDPVIDVTGDILVTGIDIEKETEVLEIDDEYKIEYIITPSNAHNKKVKYLVDNENIISIDTEGNIKALKAGQTIVSIYTYDGNYSDEITIIVKEKEIIIDPEDVKKEQKRVVEEYLANSLEFTSGEVNLDCNNLNIEKGQEAKIGLKTELSEAFIVLTSSDENIVKVNQSGNIVTVSEGQATIFLKCIYGQIEVTKEFLITVKNKVIVIDNPTIISTEVKGLNVNGYYENSAIDINNINFIIKYSDGNVLYIPLSDFNTENITTTNITKEERQEDFIVRDFSKVYVDKYNYEVTLFLSYKVIPLKVEEVVINNLKDSYYVDDVVAINEIRVKLNSGWISINLNDTDNNLDDINTTIANIYQLKIVYLDYEYKKDITIKNRPVVEYLLGGLNNQYRIGSRIDYSNIYIEKIVDGVSSKIYINTIFSEEDIRNVLKTDTLGTRTYKFVYESKEYVSENVEIIKFDTFTCIGIKDLYCYDDVINKDNIQFKFDYKNESIIYSYQDMIDKGYGENLDFRTDGARDYEYSFVYEETEIKISYIVEYYKVSDVSLVGFDEYYYQGEVLRNGKVKVYYENSTKVEEYEIGNPILDFSDFDTLVVTTDNKKEIDYIIDLAKTEDSYTGKYSYKVVNPLTIDKNETVILGDTTSFVVNVDSNYRKYTSYKLEIPESLDYTVVSCVKNEYGNYLINLKVNKDITNIIMLFIGADEHNREIETTCNASYKVTKVSFDDEDFVVNLKLSNSFCLVGETISSSYEVSYKSNIDMSCASFTWRIDGVEIGTNKNTITYIASESGVHLIELVLKVNENEKIYERSLETYKIPYKDMLFVNGNKKYGIGEVLTLAKSYLNSNKMTRIKEKLWTFAIVRPVYNGSIWEMVEVDPSDVVWSTSDESIARFDESGNLTIVGNGLVDLYVTTIGAIKKDYTDASYFAKMTVNCRKDAILVSNYEQIKAVCDYTAFNYEIVLANDMYIGPEVMTISEDPITKETIRTTTLQTTDIITAINSNIYTMDSTWDMDYRKNLAAINNRTFKEKIRYCLEIKSNLYGNGYKLDCSPFTTISSVCNTTLIESFKGPKVFVEMLSSCQVYGQDDIGFIIRDNVTIDNVTLQNCDDGFLNVNGNLDYSRLNNIGTVVEVMGDNVNIINSRIKNGRNIVRIYGKENPDEVIDVRIESCIISTAREFLVKIGANKEESNPAQITYNGKLVDVTSLYDSGKKMDEISKYIKANNLMNELYNSCSVYLKKIDGTNYLPGDINNLKDEYFMQNYVKTKVKIKNSVLENSGFFGIALESKFSGPVLGGYQFAPKDMDLGIAQMNYNGIRNLCGTSYSAVLTLEGDVRIYNWRNLKNIDSSTMVKALDGGVSRLLRTIGETTKFEFNIQEVIKNISLYEPDVVEKVDNDEYAHGGIVLYGGGKNYHMVNIDSKLYTGYELKNYVIEMSKLGDSLFVQCIPWVAGREPFRFYMYYHDNSENSKTLTYLKQQNDYIENKAYEAISKVS